MKRMRRMYERLCDYIVAIYLLYIILWANDVAKKRERNETLL